MTVSGCLVSGNSATDSTDNGFTFPGVGGGVFNAGVLTVSNSLVVGNSAGSEGGGIFNDATGTLTVRDSVVWLNSAPLGRDLFNAGTVHVNGSVIGDRTDA
jgi:hypothetical protein